MLPGVPPSADLMSDRRRHQRRLTVKELIGVQLGPANRGIVVDLSESGMRVQAAARVQLLPSSLLQFEIPGCATPLATSCEIAWADDYGKAGLRFTGFSGASLQNLRRWLVNTTTPVVVEKKQEVEVQTRTLPLPIPKPQVVTAPSYPITTGTLGKREEPREPNSDTFEARLHAIAKNLMTLTSSDGAIVALRAGGAIVCRASAGVAPPLGAPLQQDSGLAGECIRKGAVVWCPDTNEDMRVNREVCQRLNLRSTVLAPVLRGKNVDGVLEVFSSKANIYDQGDLLAMTRMAEIVAGLLDKQRVATAPIIVAETPAATQVPGETASVAAAVQSTPGETPATQGGATPPTATEPPARPSKEAAMRLPQPENGVIVCDACGHRNPEYVRDCEHCDVPLRVPELEALLDRPKVSKLLLIAFVVLAPLGSFYAGRETGAMLHPRPEVRQHRPAKTDVVRPELARQM